MTLNAARLRTAHIVRDSADPRATLWDEIQQSLPRAVALCRELGVRAMGSGEVAFRIVPPARDPDLARQVTALLGVDRFRELIEADTGTCFVLGACCAPITAPTREAALTWLTWERQLELQTDSMFMC